MRIFVSGASGVIGRRVTPQLLAAGHEVTILTRGGSGRARLNPEQKGVRGANADLFDRDSLVRAVAGHEAVINLATHMPSPAWKMVFRSAWRLNDRIRKEGAANLAHAALHAGARVLVQESFALTYPDEGDAWIDEDTGLRPEAYNRTVLDAERAVARFSVQGGRGVALRFAAFYGPDAVQLRTYVDGVRKGWAALPGRPEAFLSSVSHDDAAAAVIAALGAPAGAYNVVDDVPLQRREYFGTLARALGAPPPRFLPSWTTPLFGSVGRAMARSLRLRNDKLKRATGWSPRWASAADAWPAVIKEMGGV
jgi:nucleoside-diphosphate-sugar epimerase